MDGLVVAAIVALAMWLLVLTIVSILAVRQIGILTVFVEAGIPRFDVASDGPALNQIVSSDVWRRVGMSDDQPTLLLRFTASCIACRDLAAGMDEKLLAQASPIRLVVLLSGDPLIADAMESELPEQVVVVRDPDASSVVTSLSIHSAPFALRIDSGKVSGKLNPRKPTDLVELAIAPRNDLSESLVDRSGMQKEVLEHVV